MILVVDDEPGITQFILELLESKKLIAKGTCVAQEALKLVERGDLKILITDIAMPKLNGIELAKRLKRQRPDVRIICVSAFCEMLLSDLESAQIDYFLQKPFDPDFLFDVVETCLKLAA